jgi:CBS domain-containing protein
MHMTEICTREVATCARATNAHALAQLMRDGHVGQVVVVEDCDGLVSPVGIVTDRDLVVRVLAQGLDGEAVTAGDLMARTLITVLASEDVHDAVWHMRSHGIKRLPVVDERGALRGLVTADDLTSHLAAELSDTARIAPGVGRRERVNFEPKVAPVGVRCVRG